MDSRPHADLLLEYLAATDEPCPSCGYSLRGLTGNICPECNERLVLGVHLEEPRLGSYLAGLIGLACGTGFHGFVLAWAGWWIVFGGGGPSAGDLGALGVGLVTCGSGLAAWIRLRGRIRRAPDGVRKLLISGCWALSVATAATFIAIAR